MLKIITPQFDRVGDIVPSECPTTIEAFEEMKSLTEEQLLQKGLLNWDGKTYLFPKEWAGKIPLGTKIVTILNEIEHPLTKEKSKDDDHRFGALSYGIRTIHAKNKDLIY